MSLALLQGGSIPICQIVTTEYHSAANKAVTGLENDLSIKYKSHKNKQKKTIV